MTLRLACAFLILLLHIHSGRASDINALTTADLHAAFRNAKPGDHIQLGAGAYKGGFFVSGLAGTDPPIVFPNTDGAVVRFNTIYLPKKER
jgi:hypothetical protein